MALMDILDEAQGGAFYANAGAASGLSAGEAKAAMAKLCPAFAEALHAKAQDPEAFETLLDLLEDDGEDSFLEDPAALAGAETQEDGAAVLKDLYGTPKKALAASAALAGNIEPGALQKIAAISAASVLAVLARANQPQQLAAAQQEPEGGGLLGTIVSALVEGVVKGAQRSLAPKRRRRRYSSYYGTRRRKRATRRRPRTTTLDDIFGSILGTRRR
jgi:hypothetical protein